jgi:ribosomal protein L21
MKKARSNWQDVVLVCRKCSKKLDGGFGPKGRASLRKALRKELKLKKGRHAMFAVIKTGGKQYRVAKDDVIVVEKLEGDAGSKITFSDVLMSGDGKTVKLGKDLAGLTVTGTLVEDQEGRQGHGVQEAPSQHLSPQDRSPSD